MAGKDVDLNMLKKIEDSEKVIREAFEKFTVEQLAITWTGGKDSSLMLHMVREVCRDDNRPVPNCFSIDEGDMFPEIAAFLDKHGKDWGVHLEIIHNEDVSKAAGGKLGAPVKVADLNERNRAEVARLGYEEDEFNYEPESYVGNHLMKTATMNAYMKDNGVKGVFIGIRWDEQAARANDAYFTPRSGDDLTPAHTRIAPILHFTERDIWNTTFALKLPFCGLYKQGYRSLGARVTTKKAADVPAWEQDLENTAERGGRRQDKESIMAKLRELGYM